MLLYQYKTIKTILLLMLMYRQAGAQTIETDSVYKTKSFGFSQAIAANGFLFTSGQVGWDRNGKLIGKGGFQEQTIQCFENIKLILQEQNCSMNDVLHLRIFVTDISPEHKKIVHETMAGHYRSDYFPSTSLLCIKALAREDLMIEIEAIASIPKPKIK